MACGGGEGQRVVPQNGRDQAGAAVARDRRLAGEHLVEHQAKCIDITARIDILSLYLFR